MHTTETIIISAYFIYFNRKFNKKENGISVNTCQFRNFFVRWSS